MADPIKRRDFIKTVSLGTSIALADPRQVSSLLPTTEKAEIQNDFFTASFDRQKGTISIFRHDGTPLLSGGRAAVNFNNDNQLLSPEKFKFAASTKRFSDPAGEGKQLIIQCRNREKQTDLEIQLALYDKHQAVSFLAICKNVSPNDQVIKSLEPLRVVDQEGGKLVMPGVSKCLTNGQMYFDTGRIHTFSLEKKLNKTGDIKGVTLSNQSASLENETIHSWWNAGLFSGYENEGLVIGYLENNLCLGNLLISQTAPGRLSFLTESVYAPELILKPGKTIHSNRVVINLAADPYTALENYAAMVGILNKARTSSILNGWCSWFYTLAQVSEEEYVANTAFAAKHLKPYGLEYIQVDEGYQQWHGDWEGNARFPHGMKWLADNIKDAGFKAGIWIAPYVISEPTAVFQKHPEWLVQYPDGRLQRVGNWPEDAEPPADENPKRYCLDITHPGAAQWLHDLVYTIAHEWGYELIKIDFIAWTVFAANRFYDPTLSAAQVYHKGMEIMRKAAGDKCHILECGPGATTVGLIDSMRIEVDVNYGFAEAAWDTYFIHPACSASAAAKRFYFHKRTWVNDVDHVCMHLLNNRQSEAAATIIAMSGGNMISGDRLTQLDEYKLEVLKKITPSYGEAARPVDLFDDEMQSVFAVKINKPFAQWTVAGFFNASLKETVEKKFSFKRLGLDAGKTYLAFDFWKQQFVGELKDEIITSVQPGSVNLLTLHEKTGRPQFLSTDRHVMQGALELEQVNWNEETKTISGISTGPLNTSHNVSVYVPGEHPFTWGGYVLFHDFDSYSLKLVHNNIIQVHVRFEKSSKVNWEIDCSEFFNGMC